MHRVMPVELEVLGRVAAFDTGSMASLFVSPTSVELRHCNKL